MRLRSLLIGIGTALIMAILVGAFASAQMFQSGDSVTVPSGKTIDNMLFASGNTITIDGIVRGNVYCAGQTVTIHGSVEGSVYCAGQTVTVDGTVMGSVHLAGQTIAISGIVDGDATVAGQSVTVQKKGRIGRDILGGAQTLTIEGRVARDMTAGATSAVINGDVGRNVTAQMQQLSVGQAGRIGGGVELVSDRAPQVAPGGKIVGEVHRTVPQRPNENKGFSLGATIVRFLYILVSLLFLSLILTLLFPRQFYAAATYAQHHYGRVILTGFIVMAVLPLVVILSLVTVIGIPFAVFMFVVGLLLWIVSVPVTAYYIGHLLLRHAMAQRKPLAVMVLGTAIVAVVAMLPIINIVAMIATYIWGVGTIVQRIITRVGAPHYTIRDVATG